MEKGDGGGGGKGEEREKNGGVNGAKGKRERMADEQFLLKFNFQHTGKVWLNEAPFALSNNSMLQFNGPLSFLRYSNRNRFSILSPNKVQGEEEEEESGGEEGEWG